MLNAYKYTEPKDRRSAEEKQAFLDESKKWSRVLERKEREEQLHEDKRLAFMWESINLVPAGALREAAMTPDPTPPPAVMRSLVLTDVGPIPDSEVERLDPLVIDHTLLQRMDDDTAAARAAQLEEEAKKKHLHKRGKKK